MLHTKFRGNRPAGSGGEERGKETEPIVTRKDIELEE